MSVSPELKENQFWGSTGSRRDIIWTKKECHGYTLWSSPIDEGMTFWVLQVEELGTNENYFVTFCEGDQAPSVAITDKTRFASDVKFPDLKPFYKWSVVEQVLRLCRQYSEKV